MQSVRERTQAIKPVHTLERVYALQEIGGPDSERTLLSYIYAILLHMANRQEWRDTLYKPALQNPALDQTDKHLLVDAVHEMEDNLNRLNYG